MSATAGRKNMLNIFQVLCPTRNYGLGQRVSRSIWDKFSEPTFWEITRIRPSPDLKHGKVYGKFTFKGICIFLLVKQE
jgi:small subunit ribosomal protein S34